MFSLLLRSSFPGIMFFGKKQFSPCVHWFASSRESLLNHDGFEKARGPVSGYAWWEKSFSVKISHNST
jgi:hypothetical protein